MSDIGPLSPVDGKRRIAAERNGGGRPILAWRDEHHELKLLMLTAQTLIGRADASDVCLSFDARVSRAHAVLFEQAGQWFIRDEASRNGTTLNGEPVDHQHRLEHDATLRIGRTELRFWQPHPARHAETERDDSGEQPPSLNPSLEAVLVAIARLVRTNEMLPPTNAQIAAELGLGVSTVKSHLQRLYGLPELAGTSRNPSELRQTLFVLATRWYGDRFPA